MTIPEAVKHLVSKEDWEKTHGELLIAIERLGDSYLRAQARNTRWTVGTIIVTDALVVAAVKLL